MTGYLTKISLYTMMLPWESRCLRVTPQPNTGTGVKIPGEPVAVMAERSPGLGTAYGEGERALRPLRFSILPLAERLGRRTRAGGFCRPKPKPEDLPGGSYKSHGFLALCTGRRTPTGVLRFPVPNFVRPEEVPPALSFRDAIPL